VGCIGAAHQGIEDARIVLIGPHHLDVQAVAGVMGLILVPSRILKERNEVVMLSDHAIPRGGRREAMLHHALHVEKLQWDIFGMTRPGERNQTCQVERTHVFCPNIDVPMSGQNVQMSLQQKYSCQKCMSEYLCSDVFAELLMY
jgi:hypothetical protein